MLTEKNNNKTNHDLYKATCLHYKLIEFLMREKEFKSKKFIRHWTFINWFRVNFPFEKVNCDACDIYRYNFFFLLFFAVRSQYFYFCPSPFSVLFTYSAVALVDSYIISVCFFQFFLCCFFSRFSFVFLNYGVISIQIVLLQSIYYRNTRTQAVELNLVCASLPRRFILLLSHTHCQWIEHNQQNSRAVTKIFCMFTDRIKSSILNFDISMCDIHLTDCLFFSFFQFRWSWLPFLTYKLCFYCSANLMHFNGFNHHQHLWNATMLNILLFIGIQFIMSKKKQ